MENFHLQSGKNEFINTSLAAISKKHVTEEVDEGIESLNSRIGEASARLVLSKTNEPISPEDPRWPKKHGIRQIVVLAWARIKN